MDESDLPGDMTVTTRLKDQTCMPGLMDMHVHIITAFARWVHKQPDGILPTMPMGLSSSQSEH